MLEDTQAVRSLVQRIDVKDVLFFVYAKIHPIKGSMTTQGRALLLKW